MVCDWGMSPLGPIAFGENQETLFLGREISRSQNYSEDTAQRIDQEIHQIVEEQHQRALKILTEHRSALDTVAQGLLLHETLEGRHVLEILQHGEIRSPVAKTEQPKGDDASKPRKPREEPTKLPKELPHGAEPSGAPA
jgi:cell division protease FtsH